MYCGSCATQIMEVWKQIRIWAFRSLLKASSEFPWAHTSVPNLNLRAKAGTRIYCECWWWMCIWICRKVVLVWLAQGAQGALQTVVQVAGMVNRISLVALIFLLHLRTEDRAEDMGLKMLDRSRHLPLTYLQMKLQQKPEKVEVEIALSFSRTDSTYSSNYIFSFFCKEIVFVLSFFVIPSAGNSDCFSQNFPHDIQMIEIFFLCGEEAKEFRKLYMWRARALVTSCKPLSVILVPGLGG